MIKRESKLRRLSLSWFVVVIVLVFMATALAQDDPNAPLPYDPNMEEEPRLPGKVEGTGTYFEVTDSNYLNITLESSESVNLRLESIPQMIVMDINTAAGAASTQITLTGFPPSTTYYKYEDDYHNGIAFTTDDNGTYTFVQDLIQPHLVFIQPQPGTKFIPTDTTIGTWDPITRTYTLTTDVYETIQIDEDNLILDGAGHHLTGTDTGWGVYIRYRTGVTVKNLNVQATGIFILRSNNNTLINNTVSNSSGYGIGLDVCQNNTLTGNTASNNQYGIYLKRSNNNILQGNNASNNVVYGIAFGGWASSCSNNTLIDNTTSNNGSGGILLSALSINNILTGNNASNNTYGIYIYHSIGSTLSGNTMSGNRCNFGIIGLSDSDFDNDIDTTNTVDGKSIYYMKNVSNQLYDSSTNAGVFYAINCDNITIKDLTLTNNRFGVFLWKTHNSRIENIVTNCGIQISNSSNNTLIGNTTSNTVYANGIYLASSTGNTVTGNTANCNRSGGIRLYYSSGNTLADNTTNSNNFYDELDNEWSGCGIDLYYSSNNIVTGNTAWNNYWFGIRIVQSSDNQIYNNNFIENIICQARVSDGSGNVFNLDWPIGGNYWSNWTSPDNDNDGFVDEPYVFDGGQDNLPWANPDGWIQLVNIDIKPGSEDGDDNTISLGTQGLIPVAVFTEVDSEGQIVFDARTVNPETVELAGMGVAIQGKSNDLMAYEQDVNEDGFDDLVVHVATANFDPGAVQEGEAVLTGKTYVGLPIMGTDEITIVPPEE